jgi:hypothetical protein
MRPTGAIEREQMGVHALDRDFIGAAEAVQPHDTELGVDANSSRATRTGTPRARASRPLPCVLPKVP